MKLELDNTTLDDLYHQMRDGKMSKRKLEDEIYRFLLKDNRIGERLQKTYADFCDFLCSIYPKISKAIDTYKDRGSSFEAYIGMIIYYSHKEEKAKDHKRKFFDTLCFEENRREMIVSESESSYEPLKGAGKPYGSIARKRISIRSLCGGTLASNKNSWIKLVILVLKSYTKVEPGHIESISALTGLDSGELFKLIDNIKELRLKADTELSLLKNRVHSQYYKCLSYETRLRHFAKDDHRYKIIQEKLERAKETLDKMRDRLKHKKTDATNQQVSNVLGIPKGSVDFCVSSVRSRFYARLNRFNTKRPLR